ncbi:hypothetical protein K501DRAFT_277210 [Backusella circina FSU 941]|nr:hypothetical protein K501DRAFT_277210 [Backusella circina FSU 941]
MIVLVAVGLQRPHHGVRSSYLIPIHHTLLALDLVTECNHHEGVTQTDPLYPPDAGNKRRSSYPLEVDNRKVFSSSLKRALESFKIEFMGLKKILLSTLIVVIRSLVHVDSQFYKSKKYVTDRIFFACRQYQIFLVGFHHFHWSNSLIANQVEALSMDFVSSIKKYPMPMLKHKKYLISAPLSGPSNERVPDNSPVKREKDI